jgi:hypothetical protein
VADSSIALSPAVGGGDVLDAELLDGKKREVVVLGGDDASAEQADVRNAAPGAADYGLVTRNIPSGTQAVSGTVSVVEPISVDDNGGSLTVDGTVALDGPTLAALETITALQGTSPWVSSLDAATLAALETISVANMIPAVETGLATEATLALLKTRADLLATETKLEAVRALLAGTLTVAGTVTANLGTIDGAATEATLAALKARADLLATEAKLEAVRALLAGTLTVTGPLTDAQLRATAVLVNLDRAGTLGLGTQTTVSSVAVQIIAANANRRVLIVQNVGLNALRFGGAGVTAATGLLLSSGQTMAFTMPDTPTGAVWAIRSLAADTTAFVLEL